MWCGGGAATRPLDRTHWRTINCQLPPRWMIACFFSTKAKKERRKEDSWCPADSSVRCSVPFVVLSLSLLSAPPPPLLFSRSEPRFPDWRRGLNYATKRGRRRKRGEVGPEGREGRGRRSRREEGQKKRQLVFFSKDNFV